jgi:hypothetical protein
LHCEGVYEQFLPSLDDDGDLNNFPFEFELENDEDTMRFEFAQKL